MNKHNSSNGTPWGSPDKIEQELKRLLKMFGFVEEDSNRIIEVCGGTLLLHTLKHSSNYTLIQLIHKLFKNIVDGSLKIEIKQETVDFLIRINSKHIIFGNNYNCILLERNIRFLLLLVTIYIIKDLEGADYKRFAHGLINIFKLFSFNPLEFLPENCKVLLEPFYHESRKIGLFNKATTLYKVYGYSMLKDHAKDLFIINENKTNYIVWKITSIAKKTVEKTKIAAKTAEYLLMTYKTIKTILENTESIRALWSLLRTVAT